MASGGERRMVFDTRGKRKHVVRVVYAILALLMGASLFLVVGPVNLGALIGESSNSTSETAKIYSERAERIERKLHKEPEDEALLLSLTRARLGAGEASLEADPTTGRAIVTPEARAEFEKGSQAWHRYLKLAKGEVNPSVAFTVARASFTQAASSTAYDELFEHLDEAAAAQRIVAKARPSLNSLTILVELEHLAGNFAAAEKAASQAESLATSKGQKKAIAKLSKEKRKQGEELQKGAKEAKKAEKGKAKEALENPLGGGLSGSTGLAP